LGLAQGFRAIFRGALSLCKGVAAKPLDKFPPWGVLFCPGPDSKKAIEKPEAKVGGSLCGANEAQGFSNYAINVSDGIVVSELSKLARNAAVDLMVMGTSTKVPLATGEGTNVGSLGPIIGDIILWAPCPVLIIPPSLIPGLARG